MKRAPEGFETRLPDGRSLAAANDPVIAGTPPRAGWDPVEIWRTRVREARPNIPREGKDTAD